MAKYNTKQQKAIIDCLKNCNRHVSAAQVAECLKEAGFDVGITTIYRHLEKLYTSGIINKIIADNEKSALFCYNHEHTNNNFFHIKCEICGSISDMDCSQLSELYSHIKAEHNFIVNPKKTLFYGMCHKCSQEREDDLS